MNDIQIYFNEHYPGVQELNSEELNWIQSQEDKARAIQLVLQARQNNNYKKQYEKNNNYWHWFKGRKERRKAALDNGTSFGNAVLNTAAPTAALTGLVLNPFGTIGAITLGGAATLSGDAAINAATDGKYVSIPGLIQDITGASRFTSELVNPLMLLGGKYGYKGGTAIGSKLFNGFHLPVGYDHVDGWYRRKPHSKAQDFTLGPQSIGANPSFKNLGTTVAKVLPYSERRAKAMAVPTVIEPSDKVYITPVSKRLFMPRYNWYQGKQNIDLKAELDKSIQNGLKNTQWYAKLKEQFGERYADAVVANFEENPDALSNFMFQNDQTNASREIWRYAHGRHILDLLLHGQTGADVKVAGSAAVMNEGSIQRPSAAFHDLDFYFYPKSPISKQIVRDHPKYRINQQDLIQADIQNFPIDLFTNVQPGFNPKSSLGIYPQGFVSSEVPLSYKKRWLRPKDEQDLQTFQFWGPNNPVIDPSTGKTKFSPLSFGPVLITEEGLPVIDYISLFPGSGTQLPAMMNWKGQFRNPLSTNLGLDEFKYKFGGKIK